MPWYNYVATVDGEVQAVDEQDARAQIEIILGSAGIVDIELLDCEDCEEEDEKQSDS